MYAVPTVRLLTTAEAVPLATFVHVAACWLPLYHQGALAIWVIERVALVPPGVAVSTGRSIVQLMMSESVDPLALDAVTRIAHRWPFGEMHLSEWGY